MADIRLPPDVQPVRPAINPVLAHIVHATEAVQKMAIGQIIAGTVIGKNATGQVEVKTKDGVIQVQTTQPLIPGKPVQITIQQNGPQPQVQVQTLAVTLPPAGEGAKHAEVSDQIKSLISQFAPPPTDEEPMLVIAGGQSKAVFVRLKPEFWTTNTPSPEGTILNGKVIQTANGKIQVQTQFGTLQVESNQKFVAGTPVQLQLPRDGQKQAIILPLGQNITPQAAPAAKTFAPASNPAMAYSHAADQTPRPQNVTITFVGPEHLEDGLIPIPAKVIHLSSNNIATLRIPTGLLTLQTPFHLEMGDELLVSLNVNEFAAAATAPTKTSALPLPLGGKTLPSLDELIDLWRTQTNTPLSQFVRTVLPNVGDRFVNQTMMYLVAMSAGDSKFWLGPKLQKELEKEKSNIASKLSDEFSATQKSVDESNNAPWRHLPLPVFDGQQLNYVQCFFRNHQNEGEESQGQRFVIEANLSRLGAMQLDGFIRDQNFNLIVRTTEEWLGPVQQDIRNIFQDYMNISGWNGQLSFQAMPEFPVKPGMDLAIAAGHQQTKI